MPVRSLTVIYSGSWINSWWVFLVHDCFLDLYISIQTLPNPQFIRKWRPYEIHLHSHLENVAIHSELNLLFVTTNDHIISFRSDGTKVAQWGSRGPADGQFQRPCGIAVLSTRNWIFVADRGNHRIQVFGVDGSFSHKWGSHGQGDGQFRCPYGVAVHPTQDLVYVTERHRVQVFNLDGTFIRKWGTHGSGNGQFNYPGDVAVHPTRDLVYVAEFLGYRIQAFRSDGTFLFKWGPENPTRQPSIRPICIGIHPTHNFLFVADRSTHGGCIFDLDGKLVRECQIRIGADNYSPDPRGICLDAAKNLIYIVTSSRVSAFSIFNNNRKRKRVQASSDDQNQQ